MFLINFFFFFFKNPDISILTLNILWIISGYSQCSPYYPATWISAEFNPVWFKPSRFIENKRPNQLCIPPTRWHRLSDTAALLKTHRNRWVDAGYSIFPQDQHVYTHKGADVAQQNTLCCLWGLVRMISTFLDPKKKNAEKLRFQKGGERTKDLCKARYNHC